MDPWHGSQGQMCLETKVLETCGEGLALGSSFASRVQEPYFLDCVSAMISVPPALFPNNQLVWGSLIVHSFASLVGVGNSADFQSLRIICFYV